MSEQELIQRDVLAYLEQHKHKELLRFLTCGSVDDGKSTLIGRLLHDTRAIYDDQMAAVVKDSAKVGTTGEAPDLALLVDGLKAEREQGITIDVAYRYFATKKRKFIIADCPGHEQYTRNMATGASTCDLALILIDARKGVLAQTRRHAFIVSLLGIRHVVVLVNKMDLVGFAQETYDAIVREFRDFAAKLEVSDISFLPISARDGDNVVERSQRMPWYGGATLMHLLETLHIASDQNLIDLRFPVQHVLRPHQDFRGFSGTLCSGVMRVGDEVMALPSKRTSRVKSIVTFDGELQQAFAPQAVTVTLTDEVDLSRGEMLVAPKNQPRVAHELEAMLVWMAEQPLQPGKEYLLKQTTRMVSARVTEVRFGVDVNTMHRAPQRELALNQIGRCLLVTSQPLFVDAYKNNRQTGAFILVDRLTNNTVGAGMLLERGLPERDVWKEPAQETLQASASPVSQKERAARAGHQAATVLLTGLPGSGKTSIAHALERRLFDANKSVVVVDGQNLRRGLSKDLDFGVAGRSENLRRVAGVAQLFNDAGQMVIASVVAPTEALRQRMAEVVGRERWLVVYLDCPREVCRARDAELYARAERGELPDFPGVSSPYEVPVKPDLVLKTGELEVEASVEALLKLLRDRGVLST